MGYQHVSGEAAVHGNTEMMMRRAQIFFAGAASRAGPAADPRIDRHAAPNGCPLGRFARGLDHAGDLVAERERQRAVLGNVETLVAAQREITVLQMQVGMAYPAAFHTQQHFTAVGHGKIRYRLAERLAVSDERLTVKLSH